jgi:CDP-glucose 4,6-dehydratase
VSLFDDVRNLVGLIAAFQAHRPEIVFHLAAQPLVRRSYLEPNETFATNVMGTVHFLEAARRTKSVRVVVVVTSDKCYDNRESGPAFTENDPMGGYDPYSASKGAAELVTAAYRNSFFDPERIAEHGLSLASVRAGNVMGGGDWSEDRLIPDCVRCLVSGKRIPVRNPLSARPWQHVLEPLAGYLWLALCMWKQPKLHAGAWNFGPKAQENATVRDIVDQVIAAWGEGAWEDVWADDTTRPHEARTLELDSTKANHRLHWRPYLSTRESVQNTVAWYHGYYTGSQFDGYDFTLQQIESYTKLACSANAPWAMPNIEETSAPSLTDPSRW